MFRFRQNQRFVNILTIEFNKAVVNHFAKSYILKFRHYNPWTHHRLARKGPSSLKVNAVFWQQSLMSFLSVLILGLVSTNFSTYTLDRQFE